MEKLNELIEFYEMVGTEPQLLVWLLELRRHRESNWKQRAEAAEAKLAEYEADISKIHSVGRKHSLAAMQNAYLVATALAERPVPAVDLAELVPDEIKEKDLQGWFIGPDGKRWSSLEVAGYNKCLVHILSNIKPE